MRGRLRARLAVDVVHVDVAHLHSEGLVGRVGACLVVQGVVDGQVVGEVAVLEEGGVRLLGNHALRVVELGSASVVAVRVRPSISNLAKSARKQTDGHINS